jgi:hypothetical protein
MTEIVNIIEDIVEDTVAPVIKRKAGRPRVTDIYATGKEYFRQYYHANNHDILCECGCSLKKGHMKAHLTTKKHFYQMLFKKFEESKTPIEV